MKSTLMTLTAVACIAARTASAANTWYVDDDNYNESYANAAAYTAAGYDGKSMAKAFGTIQVAIDKASSGDTIYVAPGEYSNGSGGAVASWGASRIGWNNKKLYIYSTGDASNTHIVGAKAETDSGVGTGAIRGLTVYDNSGTSCAGTILKGFTFRDGATVDDSADHRARSGGAVCVSNDKIYFVDCVFSGCCAKYGGGAAWNGTFVRCLFARNSISESATSKTVAMGSSSSSKAVFYACVFHHNMYGTSNAASSGTMFSNVMAVNCTVLDNAFKACTGTANESFYNTVFFQSGTYNASSTFANCVKESDEPRSVMSTIIPDVRLLPNSVARTAGSGEHLSLITLPEEIDNKDFGGNTPATSGTIAAGATQTVGTPAGGGIAVKGGAEIVNGTGQCRSGSYSYVYPDVYPTQYVFTAVAESGKRLSHFRFIGNPLYTYDYRFPDRNDRLLVMPPANPDVVITNSETTVRDVTYVKPDADASEADGSAEHPYRTLQAAIDAKSKTVIVAKPGIYAEGVSDDATYGRSRLMITTMTRITSEEGAENTIIMGESDTSGEADGYGHGPDAVRCIVNVSSHAQVQGFTLTGGRTMTGSDSNKSVGGAVRCTNTNPIFYLDDCIVTNNSSKTSGAMVNTRMARCYVADNPGCSYFVDGGFACGCVFSTGANGAPSAGMFGGGRILNCTFIGEKAAGVKPYDTSSAYVRRYASVFLGGDTAGGNGTSAGNVCWDFSTVDDASALVVDPLLANPANGDCHPFAASPVFDAGVVPAAGNYGNEYWYFVTTDYDGNPISFNGGKPVAGAFMNPTAKSVIAMVAENGGLSPSASRIELEAEGTCTLTVGDGTRPVAGAVVNGVTNLAADASWSVTVSGAEAAGGIVVSALYTNVWYAAPNGSDLASGFFPEAAKTLQGALSNANIRAYDRVVALPGTYRTGNMIQAGDYAVYSRAVVPANVTLESRDGRGATIIEGAQASVKDDAPSSYDVRGLGADAIRCVLLQDGAAVKGFTLTNGWTRARKNNTTTNSSDPDTCGGGVWCAGLSCVVEDCTMVGGGAYRGAGVFKGFCRNSVFANNYAYYGGGGSSDCRNHGCLSYGNTAASWNANAGIFAIYDAVNCTCFDSLSQAASAGLFIGVTNTVVTGYFFSNSMAAEKVSHCAFNKNNMSVTAGFFEAADSTVATNIDVLVFDNYRPVIGQNICIDAGTEDVLAALTDRDALGGQRIYNGRLDIGATEADWRARYGRDIHARATVLSVDSAVVEQADGTVRIPEGASLDAALRSRSSGGNDLTIKFRVADGGTALLTLNGAEQTLAAGDHEIRVAFDAAECPFSVAAVSGAVDILHASSNRGFLLLYR